MANPSYTTQAANRHPQAAGHLPYSPTIQPGTSKATTPLQVSSAAAGQLTTNKQQNAVPAIPQPNNTNGFFQAVKSTVNNVFIGAQHFLGNHSTVPTPTVRYQNSTGLLADSPEGAFPNIQSHVSMNVQFQNGFKQFFSTLIEQFKKLQAPLIKANQEATKNVSKQNNDVTSQQLFRQSLTIPQNFIENRQGLIVAKAPNMAGTSIDELVAQLSQAQANHQTNHRIKPSVKLFDGCELWDIQEKTLNPPNSNIKQWTLGFMMKDGGLWERVEIPLTEVAVTDSANELERHNLIANAIAAHLPAIHGAYQDSCENPMMISHHPGLPAETMSKYLANLISSAMPNNRNSAQPIFLEILQAKHKLLQPALATQAPPKRASAPQQQSNPSRLLQQAQSPQQMPRQPTLAQQAQKPLTPARSQQPTQHASPSMLPFGAAPDLQPHSSYPSSNTPSNQPPIWFENPESSPGFGVPWQPPQANNTPFASSPRGIGFQRASSFREVLPVPNLIELSSSELEPQTDFASSTPTPGNHHEIHPSTIQPSNSVLNTKRSSQHETAPPVFSQDVVTPKDKTPWQPKANLMDVKQPWVYRETHNGSNFCGLSALNAFFQGRMFDEKETVLQVLETYKNGLGIITIGTYPKGHQQEGQPRNWENAQEALHSIAMQFEKNHGHTTHGLRDGQNYILKLEDRKTFTIPDFVYTHWQTLSRNYFLVNEPTKANHPNCPLSFAPQVLMNLLSGVDVASMRALILKGLNTEKSSEVFTDNDLPIVGNGSTSIPLAELMNHFNNPDKKNRFIVKTEGHWFTIAYSKNAGCWVKLDESTYEELDESYNPNKDGLCNAETVT